MNIKSIYQRMTFKIKLKISNRLINYRFINPNLNINYKRFDYIKNNIRNRIYVENFRKSNKGFKGLNLFKKRKLIRKNKNSINILEFIF